MTSRFDAVFERLRALLAAPADGGDAPSRASVERALTDGYAEALALDGERLRLTRRIERITSELVDGSGRVDELQRLLTRLGETEADLADLREILSSLRGRVARAA